jgi:hypothetical protein
MKYTDNGSSNNIHIPSYNRNNSQGSGIVYDPKSKTKDSIMKQQNSPKSYTTKIKSLVDNLAIGNTANYNQSNTAAPKTGNKHVFLEYMNKDSQQQSGVYFNARIDNLTPTETRFTPQYKEIYNTETNFLRNDGSNSNRVYEYSNLNDMKYNGPKRDEFTNKLNKKEEHAASDVHFKFNNNYVNTDDRDRVSDIKILGSTSSQKSTYIKTKLEKYYTKGGKDNNYSYSNITKDNSPQKIGSKEYPTYTSNFKMKTLDKTLSKGTFSSTLQKLKK